MGEWRKMPDVLLWTLWMYAWVCTPALPLAPHPPHPLDRDTVFKADLDVTAFDYIVSTFNCVATFLPFENTWLLILTNFAYYNNI